MTTVRVLIVDDEPIVARLHESFVAGMDGFEVVGTAGTGSAAVQAIRALQPDVVLLDMRLPGLSGIEVLRQVRSDALAQPEVIAVTATRDVDTVRDARLAGVRHYLAKPFAASDLRTRLIEIRDERAHRGSPGPLEQSQIDAMMTRLPAAVLPKGMSEHSLALVRAALASMPNATAAQVGAQVGMSRVSARKYLEFLADAGDAVRSLDYRAVGRPSTHYQLAES